MRIIKISSLILILLLSSITLTGCWNYREVDKMSIVVGVAVDKGEKEKYKVTASIIQITGGPTSTSTSKIISFEGNTIFDAVRNGVAISGERLYWAHTKVIIISKEIARKGVVSIMDWYNRDSETRFDVDILISKEDSAAKIFSGKGTADPIRSFVLDDMITNQGSYSKAPATDMVKFYNDLNGEGMSATVPTVFLKKSYRDKVPSIMGTAVFKMDKLKGYLNGEESKSFLFIKDEIKGGLITTVMKDKEKKTPVTLEIFKSKTKVTPIIKGNDVKMSIKIETETAIDEIDGHGNFIEDKGRKKLERQASEELKTQIKELIKKVQNKFDSDIFGFGAKINQQDPKLWKKTGSDWDKKFKTLEVNVEANVHIENSAMLSKIMKVRK